MGCLRLEKCCCVFDLKTGNILLGCTVSMLSFALLITMLVAAIEFGDMEKNVEKQLQIISEIEGVKEDPILRGHFAMSIIMGFMCLAKFLFDLVFVYGVCEEQPSMIKTYLIFWIVWTVLSLCIVFCTASYYDIIIIACEVFYFATVRLRMNANISKELGILLDAHHGRNFRDQSSSQNTPAKTLADNKTSQDEQTQDVSAAEKLEIIKPKITFKTLELLKKKQESVIDLTEDN